MKEEKNMQQRIRKMKKNKPEMNTRVKSKAEQQRANKMAIYPTMVISCSHFFGDVLLNARKICEQMYFMT